MSDTVEKSQEAAKPKPASASDRRQHARKPLRGSGRLILPGRPPLPIRTTDISAGGLGAVAGVNLPAKTGCTVQFGLPDRASGIKTIETKAVIALCIFSNAEDGFKIGLQFASLQTPTATVISQYVG